MYYFINSIYEFLLENIKLVSVLCPSFSFKGEKNFHVSGLSCSQIPPWLLLNLKGKKREKKKTTCLEF